MRVFEPHGIDISGGPASDKTTSSALTGVPASATATDKPKRGVVESLAVIGEEAKSKLSPSREKAYAQWRRVIEQNAALDGASDREVYNWLAERMEEGEKLQGFEAWTRYLTEARTAYGTNKHTSRAGRKTGRSIVRPEEK